MSALDELTGNKARSGAILSVIRLGATTYQEAAAACATFGNTFDALTPDEYAAAVAMVAPAEEVEFEQPDPVPAPNALSDYVRQNPPVEMPPSHGVNEQSSGVDTDLEHEAAATSEHPMTPDEANAELNRLKDALHLARQERMRLEAEVRVRRSAMAAEIQAWNGIGGGMTREAMVRAHIASEQQRKQDVKDGKLPPRGRHVANSYFDRVGAYGKGDANTFVRRGHTPGQPWRGGNRGALPASMQNAPAKLKGER